MEGVFFIAFFFSDFNWRREEGRGQEEEVKDRMERIKAKGS